MFIMYPFRNIVIILLNILCLVAYEQHDYKVILERYSSDWFNTDYIKDPKVTYFYYTRTQKRFNVSGYLLQDLNHDIKIYTQAYKFQSNEYREFPVVFRANYCEMIEKDTFGTSNIHFDTNTKYCPFKKGFFYIRNAYLNDTKLPPFAPRGRYMLNMTLIYQKHIMLHYGRIYAEIKPTNPLERVVIG